MLNKTNKIIESFLPVFSGFYESIFSPDEDQVIEDPFNWENYEFEYDLFRTDMAKACVNGIERQLPEYGIIGVKIKYQCINSPREYNFTTDAIHVEYKLTIKGIASINSYLKKNKESFAKYLKDTYTSRDGFMSSWSNDVDTWLNDYLTNSKDLRHCLGAVFEFVFQNENFTPYDLYSDYCEGVYLYGSLVNGVGETNDFIEKYSNENYQIKDVTTITGELVNHFETDYNNRIGEYQPDFLTYKYIENIVNRVFNGIEKNTLTLEFKKGK
jgi:hypothetical protein